MTLNGSNNMKIVDDIVNKIGVDRLLHFLIGALATSILSPLGLLCTIIMGCLITLLNLFKEKYFDTKFDWIDLKWCAYGALITITVNVIIHFLL